MPDRAARSETGLSETETELTPAMIEAGMDILAFYEARDGLAATVRQIYLAMFEARI
jgi:hypothetical protein